MKLTGNTTVMHPESGVPVSLKAGDDLPEWAVPLVGDHLVEKPKPARRKQG